jgi:DNA-binding Lrp family transcriptional regulator
MDDLTKQIVAILRRDGRVSFTDVAKELGTGRENVASRVNPLLETGQLRVVAGVHPLALGLKVSAHLSIKVRGDLSPVVERLQAMESPVFISVTAGAFQIIVETRQPTMTHLGTQVSEIRSLPGVVDVQVMLYERVLSSFFLGEEPESFSYEFDDTDIDLITLLQDDGRIAYADLANRVGLSLSGCRTRVLRLLESRVIQIGAVKQRSDMTDDLMFGIGINAIGDLSDIAQLLARDFGLEFMARTVGRYDLIATVSFSSLRHFNQLVSQLRSLETVSYCEQWLHVRIVRELYARPLKHLRSDVPSAKTVRD